jgi:hypothetical protein
MESRRTAPAKSPINKPPSHLLQGSGAVQRKVGPPPLASEILSKLNGAAGSVAQRKAGQPLPLSSGTVQRKHGPPPLASEILKKLIGPQGATVQRNAGPVLQRPAPRPFAPGMVSSGPGQIVQLFKVGLANYNNVSKVGPLAATVLGDATFTGKDDAVKYWLRQYVSTYATKTFTSEELKDYLYDDIIREKKDISATPTMGVQELLTTDAGFKRIKTGKQAFPTSADVNFYRTMEVLELRKLLTDEGGDVTAAVLPAKGAEIKASIKNAKELGDHLGDYKQARSYFNGKGKGNKGQALLEFTVNSSTFFNPSALAIPAAQSDFKKVLVDKFGDSYATSSRNEGTHADLPGLKSESRGVYSVGLSANGTVAFLKQVSKVTVIEIATL